MRQGCRRSLAALLAQFRVLASQLFNPHFFRHRIEDVSVNARRSDRRPTRSHAREIGTVKEQAARNLKSDDSP